MPPTTPADRTPKKRRFFYAIYSEDEQHVFGPFLTEDEADEYAWHFSLRNGVEESYGGSSTEVINDKEYRKRFPDGGAVL